jgi:hypothetical protein
MEAHYDYGTVTEAINAFRKKGFNLDFNLEENCLSCANGKFDAEEFEISEVFRYEGNTDPADEAVVYAIESNNGHKGILVTGYGTSSDPVSDRILAKLSMRH